MDELRKQVMALKTELISKRYECERNNSVLAANAYSVAIDGCISILASVPAPMNLHKRIADVLHRLGYPIDNSNRDFAINEVLSLVADSWPELNKWMMNKETSDEHSKTGS